MVIDSVTIAIAGVALAVVVLAVFLLRLLSAARGADASGAESANLKAVTDELHNLTRLVNDQLSSVTAQIQTSTGQMNSRMDRAAELFGTVNRNIGELAKATEHISEIGRDISGLQDILSAPKLRGGLGELLLGDLLRQCLPKKHYDLQYTFRNGSRVDAVIRLAGGMVPVDSKFPLENFRRVINGAGDEEKRSARRRFVADCKRHIDAIAGAYILPEEGTVNFALMYIPAENVYYEAMINNCPDGASGPAGDSTDSSLASYAFSRRVVPVSPNSFYAYLQTVLVGLRGMEVTKEAERILKHLDTLGKDFSGFMGDYETLGRHLGNARAKYDEAHLKALKYGATLGGLEGEADGPAPDIVRPAKENTPV